MKKALFIVLVLIARPALSLDIVLQHDDAAQKLFEFFETKGYFLDKVRKNKLAPQLFVTQIPHGLHKMDVHSKTHTFIRVMVPNVLKANDMILQQRTTLREIKNKSEEGREISAAEKGWLKNLGKQYSEETGDLALLLAKVDTIPPSLAITQAIEESGWGTSHFSIEGNALFGQHLASHSNGKFIEASGARVKMAAFDTVLQSTVSYMHNLNTSHAYHQLREKRSAMRKVNSGHVVDGIELSNALTLYSEIGEKYVDLLHSIMRHYQLNDFDEVRLGEADEVHYISFK